MDTNFQPSHNVSAEKYNQADKRMIRALIGTFIFLIAIVCIFSAETFAYFNELSEAGQSQIASGRIDASLVEVDGDGSFELTAEPIKIMPASVVSYGSVGAENAGTIPVYIRIKVEKTVLYSEHEIAPGWEHLISCNFTAKNSTLPEEEQDLWVYHEGYYYYKRALTPGEKTTALFDKVLFAPNMGNNFENCAISFRLICQAVQSNGNSEDPTTAWGWPADTGSSD